jgi:hypothetical protein
LIAARLNLTDDKIEPFVRIILIQPRLEIRGLIVVVKIDYPPFDIKDTVGRAA